MLNDPFLSLYAVAALVTVTMYFLPIVMARQRDISTLQGLFFTNLLFGWTGFGWLACLLWAACGATKAQDAFYTRQGGGPRESLPEAASPWQGDKSAIPQTRS